MTKNSLLCGLAVTMLAGLGLCTLRLQAQLPEQPQVPIVPPNPIVPPFMVTPTTPQAAGPTVGRFTGKVIFVESEKTNDMLSNPEIKTLGGRQFITGVGVKDNRIVPNGFSGNVTWIPVETVKRIVEFEEVDDVVKEPRRAGVPEKLSFPAKK